MDVFLTLLMSPIVAALFLPSNGENYWAITEWYAGMRFSAREVVPAVVYVTCTLMQHKY